MKKIFFIFLMIFASIYNSYGYSISEVGKKHIQVYEKLSLYVYKDGDGYSIGWGHHLLPGESYKRISKAKADKLFNEDIQKTNKSINRLLKRFDGKVKFSQSFIDGIGDLVYNCGEGGVLNSEFYKRLCNCRIKNKKFNENDLNFTIAAIKNMKITCNAHISRRYETHKRMLN